MHQACAEGSDDSVYHIKGRIVQKVVPYGKVEAKWTAEENCLKTLEVEIPVNTTAEIRVPASSAMKVTNENGLTPSGNEEGYVYYTIGSGKYVFNVVMNK